MCILFLYFLILLSCIGGLVAQTKTSESSKAPSGDLWVVPIDATVLDSPIPFKARGRWKLVYELRIASFADKGDIEITRVEVLGQNRNALVTISGDSLKASIDPEAAVGTTLKPRTSSATLLSPHFLSIKEALFYFKEVSKGKTREQIRNMADGRDPYTVMVCDGR
jgi:hypothetical protein